MTYTVPSAQNVKMKFAPAFDGVDPATIEFAIQEAAGMVDDSWLKDQGLAIMYAAAAILAIQSNTGDSGGRVVTSETIGRLSVSYAVSGDVSQTQLFDTNTYGKRFNELRRLNCSGPLVA